MRIALIIAALVCFVLAAFGAPVPVVFLIPLGLAFYMASLLVKTA